jgi:hypothetical protein
LVRHRVTVGSVPRVLRRSLTILLPLSIAIVATGCTTFSDNDAVARVDDIELTRDEFDDRLTELGVGTADVVPLDPVRDEIGTWINQQLVADIDIGALYDQGTAVSGVVCLRAIVVEEEATADAALAQLTDGAAFADVFTENNLDQSLEPTNGAIPCLGPQDIADNAATPFVATSAEMGPDTPLATAPLLDTAGGVFGWVVLSFRSFDELDPAEVEGLAGLVDVSDAAGDADVYVDPRFGTFDRDTGTVVGLG